MRRLAALLTVVTVIITLAGHPASSESQIESVTPVTPAKPLSAQEARLKATGCKKLYTRKQHRGYVSRVYRSSSSVTKHEHHRSYVRTRCQHTLLSEQISRRKWRRERRARSLIFRKHGTNRAIGFLMLRERRQPGQFGCLNALWTKESHWSTTADNPRSDAYGIPQANPGWKMASAGPGWRYDARTQIRWGLGYIAGRYGSPCNAWSHSRSTGWY